MVNKDFDDQLAKLLEVNPNIEVITGGHEEERRKKIPAALDHPLLKLKKFCEEKEIKLVKLFHQIDKDSTENISKDDFRGVIQVGTIYYIKQKIEHPWKRSHLIRCSHVVCFKTDHQQRASKRTDVKKSHFNQKSNNSAVSSMAAISVKKNMQFEYLKI